MIYIEDYSNLPVSNGRRHIWDLTSLMGQAVSVRTEAGDCAGIVVGEDADTLTLAYRLRTRGRTEHRSIIVAKRHIVAIETRLR